MLNDVIFNININPYLTNGFSHHYHLGESTFILGVLGVIFIFIYAFLGQSIINQFFHLYGRLAVLSHFYMPPILKLCIIRLKHSCSLQHTTLKTKVIKSALKLIPQTKSILPIHENFTNLHDSHQDSSFLRSAS